MPAVTGQPPRPARPYFSSGPCAKRPGWSLDVLRGACLGRSHRSAAGREKLARVIGQSRDILGVPASWRVGIVAGSDTGAMEAAMWSLLGPRGVDVLAWDSFGFDWARDVTGQLRLPDTRCLEAPCGDLPDLGEVDPGRDTVFTWNGTTAGVRVPDGDWIAADRTGLVLCDATSAVFAMPLPWDKLDVVTWSWQKGLGGEAQHGMLALGPAAVERLESRTPAWPMPKLFRLTGQGRLNEAIFRGDTINTPSMLCVEDQLDALQWAAGIGGLPALAGRCAANFAALADWVAATGWVDFLAARPEIRSTTSVCLRFTDPRIATRPVAAQQAFVRAMTGYLAAGEVALDIGNHRAAPPGLRIWCGPTVDTADIVALGPWLDRAFAHAAADL